jgi:integrative and conjugative element protein (TIGR02256 family)
MTIWIPQTLADQMSHEASLWAPLETGGSLMGYLSDQCDIVVTALVPPGPCAKRTRISFAPDTAFQIAAIARLYEASGRMDNYLGDWHTHPGGRPTLSSRDRKTLEQIARWKPARSITPVMVILSGQRWQVTPWRYSKGISFWKNASINPIGVSLY